MLEIGLVIAILVMIVATRADTLRQPLLESHGFRQTQTAFTTALMHDEGIDWLHPKLPVFGSPWEVPFEFPLFQASASVLMARGIGSDVADRAAGLAWFCATAVVLYVIVRRYAGLPQAIVAVVAFGFSPFALQWSRASLIEFAATATTLGWVLCGLLWRDRPRWWLVAVGAPIGAAAMATKPTTAAVWLLPLLVFRPATDTPGRRLSVPFGLLLGLPLFAGLLWTRHADAIRAANPATTWLTESELREWNYGTLDQRLTAANIESIMTTIERVLTGRFGWIAVCFGVLLATRNRSLWIAVFATAPIAISIFFNLYVVHDYYLAAISPAVAMTVGVGLVAIVERIGAGRMRAPVIGGIAALWLASTLWFADGYWHTSQAELAFPEISAEAARLTEPVDRVLVAGREWNPDVLYYAHRRGMMLEPRAVTRADLERLPDLDDYRLLLSIDPHSAQVDMASVRPWWGPAGVYSIRLGGSLDELDGVPAAATTDGGVVDRAIDDGSSVAVSAPDLPCDGATRLELPAGSGDLWVAWTAAGDAQVSVVEGWSSVPPGDGMVVRAGADDRREPVSLGCTGGGTLHIDRSSEISSARP